MQLRSRGTNELIDLADGMTIGRMADCTIQLQDGSISRHHASIEAVSGELYLVDNGSSNGCFRNGERTKRFVIRSGDLLTLGALAFDVVGPAVSAPSSAEPAAASKPSTAAAPTARYAESSASSAATPSASSRASEAAAERARLRHEISGNHRSSGLGDLGQQPIGIKVLAGLLGLAIMYGVITGIRYLADSL